MKYTLLILTCLLMASCQPKDLPTQIDIKENYALVKMSHMTTKSEMERIKKELKMKCGLDFNYGKSFFFEDGKLRGLSFQFTNKEGKGGSASADLMSLQNNYYGLLYNPTGNPSIKTGSFGLK